jgi:tetratricopeptide (TPR) repeat protein
VEKTPEIPVEKTPEIPVEKTPEIPVENSPQEIQSVPTDTNSINIDDIIKPGTILEGTYTALKFRSYTDYDASLTIIITDVEGTEFKGTIDSQSPDYHIGGNIRGVIYSGSNKIRFTPYEATTSSNGVTLDPNVQYYAELKDGVLSGYSNYSNDKMAGTFSITPTANPTHTAAIDSGASYSTANEFVTKGDALGRSGRYNEAIQAYDKAIEIDPKLAIAWSNKGNVLGRSGRYNEAIQACDKAIEIDSKLADALQSKGISLIGLGRYDEAIQALDKAIEIKPNNANAWTGKGIAFRHLGRYDEASVCDDKAAALKS